MAGIEDAAARLRAAILTNQRLSGAAGVLSDRAEPGLLPASVTAPIMLSQSETELRWPDAGSEPDGEQRLKAFERLSLAARLALAAASEESSTDYPVAPVAAAIKVRLDAFPTLQASVISGVILELAEAIASADPAIDHGQRALARRGLHLEGVRLVGDLELVNANLPFSVRLIGCVIEGAVIADHCRLLTLDLSGTALRGLHATFLQASGNVRMRRTCSHGAVDMGGARIKGVLDASDSVISAYCEPPPVSAFAGDRGVLNLSLATVENEFRMNRARVYGGVAMKGAIIHRAMFMDRACLYSPLATLEKLACQHLERDASLEAGPALRALLTSERSDAGLAEQLHADDDLRKAEVFGAPCFAHAPERQGLLYRLLAESTRARSSALRADGLTVMGGVFARGLRADGRVRLKYARINGGLHLEACRLRSQMASDSVLTALHQLDTDERSDAFLRMARVSGERAHGREKGDDGDFALDVRDIRIESSLHMGLFNFGPGSSRERHAEVMGRLLADAATVIGDVDLTGVRFRPGFADLSPRDRMVDKPSLSLKRAVIHGDLNLQNARGVRSLYGEALRLSGSLRLGAVTGAEHECVEKRCQIVGRINLHAARIGGDAALLFALKAGITLKLTDLVVDGVLSILPALVPDSDGRDLERSSSQQQRVSDDLKHDPTTSIRMSTAHYRLIERDVLLDRRQDEAEERRGYGRRAARDDIQARSPEIDLSGARAKVFQHPPSAWPLHGQLRLQAFTYDRVRRTGPLGPLWPDPPRSPGALSGLMAWLWGLALFAAGGLLLCSLLVDRLPAVFQLLQPLAAYGRSNILLAGSLVLGGVGLALLARTVTPTLREARPMALTWLDLQARKPNRFQRGGLYDLTAPYLQAARALRRHGRLLSADWVEEERLRRRAQTLDWRHHAPIWLFMLLVDWFSGFGFKLGRTAFFFLALAIAAAAMFQWGDTLSLMQPVAGSLPHGRPEFLSLAYAADLLIPFLDLGVAKAWRIDVSSLPSDAHLARLIRLAPIVLQIVGAVLTTIVAVAVGSRIETYISRLQE
jgi:hypothetical protein